MTIANTTLPILSNDELLAELGRRLSLAENMILCCRDNSEFWKRALLAVAHTIQATTQAHARTKAALLALLEIADCERTPLCGEVAGATRELRGSLTTEARAQFDLILGSAIFNQTDARAGRGPLFEEPAP